MYVVFPAHEIDDKLKNSVCHQMLLVLEPPHYEELSVDQIQSF